MMLLVVAVVVLAVAVLSAGRVGASGGGALRCGWRPVAVPAVGGLDLTAVAARASNDVWFVGTQRGDRTIALHYDGRSLKVVPAPTPTKTWHQVTAVATVGARDVWVVGSVVTRTEPVSHSVPVALHYDGHSWRQVAVPAVAASYGSQFHGVAGAASNDVWAVGNADDDKQDREGAVGLIQRWDGQNWQTVRSAGKGSASVAGGIDYYINAVVAVSRTNVWAAGTPSGDMFNPGPPTAHWDGTSWKLVNDAYPLDHDGGLAAVSASGMGNVWFVGGAASGPFVERYDGRRFTRLDVPYAHFRDNYENKRENSYFTGVAAVAGGGAWAVGNFGIEHYDGHRWTLVSKDTSYVAIAAATPTDIWAASAEKVIHYTCK